MLPFVGTDAKPFAHVLLLLSPTARGDCLRTMDRCNVADIFCLGAASALAPPSPPQAAATLRSGAPAALKRCAITSCFSEQRSSFFWVHFRCADVCRAGRALEQSSTKEGTTTQKLQLGAHCYGCAFVDNRHIFLRMSRFPFPSFLYFSKALFEIISVYADMIPG
jgi:hypothetical protein